MGENIQIAYKQPKNIKQLVGGPSVGGGRVENNAGCTKCTMKCQACKVLLEGTKFKSTNSGKCYNIKQKVNCQTSYIVYLVTCQKCSGQYVGKSTQAYTRRQIKNRIGGLGQHYGGQQGCGYENLTVMIIEKVENGNPDLLAKR